MFDNFGRKLKKSTFKLSIEGAILLVHMINDEAFNTSMYQSLESVEINIY